VAVDRGQDMLSLNERASAGVHDASVRWRVAVEYDRSDRNGIRYT
jgi:hypothetical protein